MAAARVITVVAIRSSRQIALCVSEIVEFRVLIAVKVQGVDTFCCISLAA